MAITYTKRQEELAKTQQPAGSNNAYNGMKGVSQNTANNLGNYQAGYNPGQAAQQAQQNMQNVQAQKPQGYNSKWAPQMENILQQIQNPNEFKYEFNADNLFKYYADLYAQNGKQASMDAMGQAAALTGGYGNSYGQQVGQQTYQEYLRPLYDIGLDLRDRAYQQYQDQIANNKDAYQLMADAENRDYGMYRDTMGDWENERAYATDQYNTERNFDYNAYSQGLDYWSGLAAQEASLAEQQRQADIDNQYRYDALAQDADQFAKTDKLNWAKLEQDEQQFEATLSEQQLQDRRDYAMSICSSILANGQIPSNELLVAAGLSLEDAQKLIAQAQGNGGTPTKPKKAEEQENTDMEEGMSWYDAQLALYRDYVENNPNADASTLSQYARKGQTVGDIQNAAKNVANQRGYTTATPGTSTLMDQEKDRMKERLKNGNK